MLYLYTLMVYFIFILQKKNHFLVVCAVFEKRIYSFQRKIDRLTNINSVSFLQMFNFLIQNVVLRIDINIRNNEGVTALQMLDRKEMEALGMSCYDYHTTREEVRQQEIEVPQQHTEVPQQSATSKNEWLKERMNTIMIVAALIAGIAFQAVINPPGGVFQEDSKIDSVKEPVMFTYYLRNFINNTAVDEGFHLYYSHIHNLPQQKSTRGNITADDIITYRANFVNDLLTAAKNSESLARSVFTYKSKKLAPGIILDDDWWMNITSNFNTTYGGGSGFSPYLMQYAGTAIMACASPNAYQSYILLNSLALVVCALTVLIVTFDAIKQRPSSTSTTSIVRYLEVLVATAVACIILSYMIVIKTIAPPFWDYGYVKSQLLNTLVAFTCMPLLTFHILGSRTLSRFGVWALGHPFFKHFIWRRNSGIHQFMWLIIKMILCFFVLVTLWSVFIRTLW